MSDAFLKNIPQVFLHSLSGNALKIEKKINYINAKEMGSKGTSQSGKD